MRCLFLLERGFLNIERLRRTRMKILIYGNGGREHSIAWKLSKSKIVEEIFMVDPNPLMESLGKSIHVNNFEELTNFAVLNKIDLVLVGPEDPLTRGIIDVLAKSNVPAFGPPSKYAWLESSKIRAKEFNFSHSIPCARSVAINNLEVAKRYISEFTPPYVLKADGLAGGKGVSIIDDQNEAINEVKRMLSGKFGNASKRLLIEEFLEGKELSAICLYDGTTLYPLDFVRDHKRLSNFDKGPNTGGMGAYSPVSLDSREKKDVLDLIEGISKALKSENISYKGVLYIGLMITKDDPKVLEYNVRFGDPETQVLMVRLKNDFGEVLKKVMENKLNELTMEWGQYTNLLVIAAKGYPENPVKHVEIQDFTQLANDLGVMVFGASITKENGKLFSNGGRVLNVVAVGKDAHERTLEFAKRLKFEAKIYRTDIGG